MGRRILLAMLFSVFLHESAASRELFFTQFLGQEAAVGLGTGFVVTTAVSVASGNPVEGELGHHRWRATRQRFLTSLFRRPCRWSGRRRCNCARHWRRNGGRADHLQSLDPPRLPQKSSSFKLRRGETSSIRACNGCAASTDG